jgi:NAD(P)-dependent dehydrogenase (short-subunit alcohol dehydrogenase family)
LQADHKHAHAVKVIRSLENAGATVHVAALDIANTADVRAFFAEYERDDWPPVRGVIHAAGVLHHHTLLELTAEQLATSLRPKLGAWTLHQVLEHAPLDFFVLFSSASALLSSPKLSAYAAANCFLDALAHYRHGQGQPALSVNWGVWSETGMAAQFDAEAIKTLADRGMGTMRTEQGLDALGRLLDNAHTQAAVLPVNWQRWAELYPSYTAAPFLRDVLRHTHVTHTRGTQTSHRTLLFDASLEERPEQLTRYLSETLGTILGFASDDVDATQPISTLGLDSLTAVEFKNRIAADLGVSLPTVRFLQGPAIAELVLEIEPLLIPDNLADDTARDVTGHTATRESTAHDAALLDRVDELSDTEVDAALAELLRGHQSQ